MLLVVGQRKAWNKSCDTWHSEWNSYAEPQTLHQSSDQQILLQWNGREGRVILMGRVYVWSGLLLLINWILNELSDDLMFFIRVLIYLARSSYCHSLIPESEQIPLTDICHQTPLHPRAFSSFLVRTFFSYIFFPSSRSVCLEQTFFPTHFFSSRGIPATGMRPGDGHCLSY